MFVQFILIFDKAQNSTLRHMGLYEIYCRLHLVEGDQEDHHPAIADFKAQVLLSAYLIT